MSFAFYTSLGPTPTPGGWSGRSFGAPGLPFGFGFPSFGDPLFYFMPAASSFFINRLLGFANGSSVNINIGPTPAHLGFGGLLLGTPFYADSGIPGGDPFTLNPYGPNSPGYGTAFGGGGFYAPPGYGGPFNTPFNANPADNLFAAGNPFSFFGGNGGPNPFAGLGGGWVV